jgi:hypothetical protein
VLPFRSLPSPGLTCSAPPDFRHRTSDSPWQPLGAVLRRPVRVLCLVLRPTKIHIPLRPQHDNAESIMLTKDVVKFGAFVVTNQVRRCPPPIGGVT